MIKTRKMTPSEIAERDDKEVFEKMTRAQLRKEHYERKAKEEQPKPKRRKKT